MTYEEIANLLSKKPSAIIDLLPFLAKPECIEYIPKDQAPEKYSAVCTKMGLNEAPDLFIIHYKEPKNGGAYNPLANTITLSANTLGL